MQCILLSNEEARVLSELLEKTIESNLAVLQYYRNQYPEKDSIPGIPEKFGEYIKTKLMLETNQLTTLQDRLLTAKSHQQPTESQVTH